MPLFEANPTLARRTLAVWDGGLSVTYGDLDAFTRRLTDCVGGRRLCLMLCENSPGILLFYLACLRCGVVPLLLDARTAPALAAQMAQRYRPELLCLPTDCPAMEVLAPGAEQVMVLHDCVLLRRPEPEPPALHPDLALLLTTSGSTGSPKLVRQSRRNVESNARSIVSYLALDARQRPITTLPMSYTYGLSIIHSHVLAGATLLLTDRSVLERPFWGFFAAQRATSLAGVPYTYQMFQRIGLTENPPPTLELLTQAGGKLPEELHRHYAAWAEATARRFVVMYGQTEATARMGYLPFGRAVEKCGSMGVAIPGGSFTLEDETGRVQEGRDAAGELVYQGPNVAMGYAEGLQDLALGDLWGGVLHTGDLARRDEDGFYYIIGRKKRFIKLYGNRVGLDETERLLCARFPGAEFACTGGDDQMLIFTVSADPALPGAVKRYLAELTRLPPSAFAVSIIKAIPKNESGKTCYNQLSDIPPVTS